MTTLRVLYHKPSAYSKYQEIAEYVLKAKAALFKHLKAPYLLQATDRQLFQKPIAMLNKTHIKKMKIKYCYIFNKQDSISVYLNNK